MRSFIALSVVTVFLATRVSASSFTISLTKHRGTGAYLKGLPKANQDRVNLLKNRGASGSTTVPLTTFNYSSYTASVGIGSPPTYYNLIVDTGSSNTFCGTGKPYVQTSTSFPTGQVVNVTYGSGNFTGLEYLDQMTLAPNLVIKNQSIGDALHSAGFQGVDGIIGFGPLILTNRTLPSEPSELIPTVMNNLVSQGVIKNQVLGVSFAPPKVSSDTNGALTFGGVDSSLYEGDLAYIPLTTTNPAALYWGINITLCMYGDKSIISTSTAGIVDTGTSQILLADDFFDKYMKAIPGATYDNDTGLIDIPPSSIPCMHDLIFFFGNDTFILDVSAQLIPTNENEGWGGVPGKQYGIVGKGGGNSGSGLDYILGMSFMERYYTVFDADQNRIGFAYTNHTFSIYESEW